MYSKEEVKQIRKDFWTAFGEFCQQLPRYKFRHKPWILYNTKVKGVEMKFDATRDGAYVIFELNNRNPRKRAAMMELMRQYRIIVEEHFKEAIWEDAFVKECGTEVSRIYKRNPDLNIHKREQWHDFFVFLSKNMSMLEKAFEQVKEQLEEIANDGTM
ncbi:MAG: DUF4268 domain-containing protein [Paludibacteraceae bacterium]|nr:DUF4268 domain-containing protein [Candidatus Physcocola equi]MCQ2234449.1 DUF4268 domain-containing protein [Paludibacteraceae bacterium]